MVESNNALRVSLKELRESKRLTQAQVAKLFYISRSAWSNYETGRRVPNPELIKQIAAVFETDINHVMGIENSEETITDYFHRKMKRSKFITPEGYLDISSLSTIEKIEILDFREYLEARSITRKKQQKIAK